MRHAAIALLLAPLLLPSGCERREPAAKPAVRVVVRPEPITGNAPEYGLRFTRLYLKEEEGALNVRFEVANDGKGIVQLVATPNEKGQEAALLVERFEEGAWKRLPATAAPSAAFVELWPGATDYGRARLAAESAWIRVGVQAKGLTTTDGRQVPGTLDVFSDAFELPTSR